MLRIRLRRTGKRGQAYYRVVVADQRFPRDGRFLESLGAYDPHKDPPESSLNAERAREWLSKGAQPSEAAAKILRRAGVLDADGAIMAAAEAAPATETDAEADAPADDTAAAAEAPAESDGEAAAEPALATEGAEA